MQCFVFALFIAYAAANEFDWMYAELDRPINWTIQSKNRYDIHWEKACGDPHAMLGEGRWHNETLCFDFGDTLPDNSKLKVWEHKKYNWEVRLVLTKKIPTASGLEVHHDFIDEVILFFNGKEKVRATKYHGVFWPDPAINPTSADNNLVSVTYADTFSFTDGNYTVELADNVVTFIANPKPSHKYEFIIYQNQSLVVELLDGWTGGKLSGAIGRFHELRIFTDQAAHIPKQVGDRAVAQLNSDNDRVFEVEKIIHSHPHAQEANGFDIPHECWHPLPYVDSEKYAYDFASYLI